VRAFFNGGVVVTKKRPPGRHNGTVEQELEELAQDIARLADEVADIREKFEKLMKDLEQKKGAK
jgi:predicted  nucleic acid-binding Zn-ribbon protein